MLLILLGRETSSAITLHLDLLFTNSITSWREISLCSLVFSLTHSNIFLPIGPNDSFLGVVILKVILLKWVD